MRKLGAATCDWQVVALKRGLMARGHGKQADLPVLGWYSNTLHAHGAPLPRGQLLPAGHGVDSPEPAGQKQPGAQGIGGEEDAGGQKKPGGQSPQPPVPLTKNPERQLERSTSTAL